jgi:hypothetical protein
MTTRFTSQGCKVVTTCVIQPNGTYTENIELSVDPASVLSLEVEEHAGRAIGPSNISKWTECPTRTRVRATKFGFELVPR